MLISSCGTPVTVINSLNEMVIGITSSKLYVPSTDVDVILLTTGAPPSIIIALLAPNDPAVPGSGRIKFAALPGTSVIVPPFKTSAVVS